MKRLIENSILAAIARPLALSAAFLGGLITVLAYCQSKDWEFAAFLTLAMLALANLDRGQMQNE